MAANCNPTVRRRRLGAELRRLRLASGLKTTEVAKKLMVSQPKISHLENGNRAISPRDVRDLCALYGVTDRQVIDALMQMARESGQQGWWHAYGDIPQSVYVALETDATSLHTYEPMVIPGLLQTPAYAHAVIEETIPQLTVEQAATLLKVRLRRQHRIYNPASPLRLWAVLDEVVLRRVVGSPDIMREQLEHLNALGAEPHISVQVLPCTVGAHPGLSGQFSILKFTDSPDAVVYLERFTSDLYLDGPSEVQHYSVILDHLQAQALDTAGTRDFITDVTKTYIDEAASRRGWTTCLASRSPDPTTAVLP
ncbi:Helix-turn-helix domain-containing protein [Streptomyces sp. 1222.5]|uniref:helix-turn-helix domain-containing protein n=1 Tax=Streptomyces sp. 1222.5 TaxID=1881026 RepID=UPI000898A425|nr:helix-turn-helix transcriptional regulator [Streptomyces sp. 1222.5]SEB52238.1 Helix-turn-helix domain-containing protein [Streptomyces sp. 1222.5]